MSEPYKPFTWIGLCGAIPEEAVLRQEGWSELGTRYVVSRLASRIFDAGSGIVYGSHPTFIPLVEAARASVPRPEGAAKALRIFGIVERTV